MQTQPTPSPRSPGGHSRDDLLHQAGALHDADPVRMARLHPYGQPRYEEAGLFRDVVAYLQPILKIIFQSHEVELARRASNAQKGEVGLRFVLRSDGTIVKYDQAHNSDTASPLEFLREPGDLDAALAMLELSLSDEGTPIALAAAEEVSVVRGALGSAPDLRLH